MFLTTKGATERGDLTARAQKVAKMFLTTKGAMEHEDLTTRGAKERGGLTARVAERRKETQSICKSEIYLITAVGM